MAEEAKSQKRVSPAYPLLDKVDKYVTEVQKGPYAHRMRVALFWSVASLFYIFGGLKMDGLALVSVEGITHKKFCVFLLTMTAYFTILFFFAFLKVWLVHRPVRRFRVLFRYSKKRTGTEPGSTWRVDGEKIDEISEALGLFEAMSNTRPGVFREDRIPLLPEMKSGKEVLEFMVTRARMGWLENLVFRMYLPVLLCVWALSALVLELWNLR